MRRIGLGSCSHCDVIVASYRGRDGQVKVFRHGYPGVYGAMLRVPRCDGSYKTAAWAKGDSDGNEIDVQAKP